MFIPLYTAQVVADIVSRQDLATFVRSVVVMSVLTLVATVFGGLRGGCFTYSLVLLNRKVRCDLLRSITRQEIAFFDKAQTGEIVSRLTADCEKMSSTVATNLNVVRALFGPSDFAFHHLYWVVQRVSELVINYS